MSLPERLPQDGASLLLPLTRLDAAPSPVVRLLHLDAPRDTGFGRWVDQVRDAAEACLLLDADGRVAAMSRSCGDLLAVDPTGAVGALLLDLVELVDFAAGLAVPDPEVQAPPLRSLATGRLTRGLVRLSSTRAQRATYDVVGVPVSGGVLAFLSEV
ncbi:MAG: fold-4 domain protein [Frankiales bacterium]|nr:fold-4 domain protein [Frankiales bacterium]